MMNRETTGCASAPRDELARSVTLALEAAAESAARELDRHAAGFGLSDAKLEVMEVLTCCDRGRSCLCELGDRLHVTRPNITKLVDGLQRAGLVERLPHPGDRRMVQAHLTVRGTAVAQAALPGRAERIAAMWERLSDEELEALLTLLRTAVGREAGAPTA
jgi:DNA-binding MarR family transcriptional regulator